MTLCVVGSVGMDTVETPFGRAEDVVGGSAVYFSLAASLFTKVQVVANVGHDFPDQAWDPMRQRGADLAGVRSFADQPTFRWSGRYSGDMNEAETLKTELNVLAEPPQVPADFVGAPFVFLANMGTDVQLQMLDSLHGGIVFADTMNLWIETQPDALRELLGRVHGLILNDAEARMLTGEQNLVQAGASLLAMGPKVVVIKKGEHGAFLFEASFRFALPAYPTAAVVDPTGAGDSFAGGFLGSLADLGEMTPANLRRAMAYGTVAASCTVEKFSTEALSRAERSHLDERFAELQKFVQI